MSSFAQPLTSPLSGLPPTALCPSFLLPFAFRLSAHWRTELQLIPPVFAQTLTKPLTGAASHCPMSDYFTCPSQLPPLQLLESVNTIVSFAELLYQSSLPLLFAHHCLLYLPSHPYPSKSCKLACSFHGVLFQLLSCPSYRTSCLSAQCLPFNSCPSACLSKASTAAYRPELGSQPYASQPELPAS